MKPQSPQSRKEPQQARSRAMVDTILDATARVLIARGYAKTNTNLVAAEAGISVGSLYQYFSNKDALIFALRERHLNGMLEIFRKIARCGTISDTLSSDLNVLIGAMVATHLVQPELHRIFNEEVPAKNFPVDDKVRRLIFEEIKALLEKHRKVLTVPDIDLAAFILIKIFRVLVTSVVRSTQEGIDPKQLQSEILPVIIGYLCAVREA
ncbi:TetR/AcrR family transcriptional regulator [Herbaspirillum sp. RTI4]|uniref:TetR/AcrR family transcriptional regulator n=1 Tax=Herbaspirillum sp. RTI4 TaxID=3048640 RepID=UPI002AB3A9CE|nr:TetR/AcrR family transcriptional regulator [Herbaspirillum sp. RTI4]MDY7578898.1 TetR/AcrR family transcriptional regulator [Herbaspirillum sp. RTI4]MEA9981987.1 TetR/AcrR family transcriptional regulator [Herbaspirillum sp. RTI4]